MVIRDDGDVVGEELPESFQPSKYDVIVGWARQNYHHEGNRRLRDLVKQNVPRYLAAGSKNEKGDIIVEILEIVKRESPSGLGLLKQNPKSKRWYYIGTEKAKDKIGHALRKACTDGSAQAKELKAMKAMKREGSSNLVDPKGNNHNHQYLDAQPGCRPSIVASPQSAFSSAGSMALKSFKTGPPIQRGTINGNRSSLESWPLRCVTSLSSSESHSEELHQHQPVQVTVPSSPVTRPSSAASNVAPAPPHYQNRSYHHSNSSDTHNDGHDSSRSYYGPPPHHFYPYHPHPQYVKHGNRYYHHSSYSNYRQTREGRHYSPPINEGSDPNVVREQPHAEFGQPFPHHSLGEHDGCSERGPATSHYDQHQRYYEQFPPEHDSSGSFHCIFDEVDKRFQQEEQQQRAAYHHHEHSKKSHPSGEVCEQLPHDHPSKTCVYNNSSYSRIVSNEGISTAPRM